MGSAGPVPSGPPAARRSPPRLAAGGRRCGCCMNNLDPEVAERPDDLVVYGGTGRAARDWPSFDAIVRDADRPARRRDDAGAVRPAGRRAAHPRVGAAGAASPTRNLVGDWATWPEFRRLERLGLTMYGQMTAGSWIYIGTQGILQGTYETFAAVAAKRFGGTLAGTLTLTAGCGGMGGAQPLAVTMNGGRLPGRRRRPGPAARAGSSTATWTGRRRRSTRRSRLAAAARAGGEALSVGVRRQRRRGLPRAAARAASTIDIVTDQTCAHDPLSYLPVGVDLADWRRLRRGQARGVHRPGPGVDGPARRGDGRLPGRRRRGLRLRQLDPRRGPARRLRAGVRLPRLRARLHPAAVLRGQGPVPVGGAVRRPGRHRAPPTGPCSTCSRTTSRSPAGSGWPGRRSRSRGCRPGSAGSGTASGTRPGCASTTWSPAARCRAPLVIGRDHLDCRVGRLAVPGDRGDGRRLGRDRRLAAAQRPGQHRLRGVLGVHPPRRRGRHRPVDPRRAGLRGRRHRAGRRRRSSGCSPTTRAWACIRHVDAGYDRAAEVAAERGRARADARGLSGRRWRRSAGSGRRCAAIGRAADGGYRRVRPRPPPTWPAATGSAAEAARARAAAGGRPQRQPVGLVGRARPRTRVVTGSHLDSVPARRRVRRPARHRRAASLAVDAAARAGLDAGAGRWRWPRSSRRRAAGSASPASARRLLTGALDPAAARALTRRATASPSPRRSPAPGSTPRSSARTPSAGAGSAAFVELHVEQGRALATLDARSGWPARSGRTGAGGSTFTGAGDHAGTTRLADRHDPMLAFAATVAGRPRARPQRRDARATVGRVARRPERHQRDPVAVDGLAGRPRRDRRRDRRGGRRRARGRAGRRRPRGSPTA